MDALVKPELDKIVTMVQPLISAGTPGTVSANMVYDQMVLAPQAAGVAEASPMLMAWIGSGWTGPAAATGLALLAMFLMLMMVRRASKPESLPTVEQLAGIPPTLDTEDDEVVGDAMEDENIMDGVEIEPKELQSRKVAQQIGEMIKANPREAGHILGKWVQADDY